MIWLLISFLGKIPISQILGGGQLAHMHVSACWAVAHVSYMKVAYTGEWLCCVTHVINDNDNGFAGSPTSLTMTTMACCASPTSLTTTTTALPDHSRRQQQQQRLAAHHPRR